MLKITKKEFQTLWNNFLRSVYMIELEKSKSIGGNKLKAPWSIPKDHFSDNGLEKILLIQRIEEDLVSYFCD